MNNSQQIDVNVSDARKTYEKFSKVIFDVEEYSLKYSVIIEFILIAKNGNEHIEHEVYSRILRDTLNKTHAYKVRDLFLDASPQEVLLYCLYNDAICITEVFNVNKEDPMEGDTNWFKRHGLPDTVKILAIENIDVRVHESHWCYYMEKEITWNTNTK